MSSRDIQCNRTSPTGGCARSVTAGAEEFVLSQCEGTTWQLKRQHRRRVAYSASEKGGHQTSAEFWGTGRAIARISRVGGSDTHCTSQRTHVRADQTWRKWHVKIEEVMATAAESFTKTKGAVALKSFTAYADLVKVSSSRKLRAHKGKMQNRRHPQHRVLPMPKISNPNVTRLINSDKIQSAVRLADQDLQRRP
ncbi:60S ribosomal protein L4-B [Mycena venus]|uniref:60S ribosomal protein L4-B n=1 Tax=Mycena venus TaxID=2733690 RepID=A0A8H6YTT7_9AGAR|nr:60S ribosomal protein L4-B [Mycena venus]